MSPALHAHIKHLLIAAGCLIVLYVCVKIDAERRLKSKQIDAETQIKVKANEATIAQAQAAKTVDTQSNMAIDRLHDQQIASLNARLNAVPDAATIRSIVVAALPGSTATSGDNGQVTIQTTADAVNRADVAFKSCQFDRDDCLKKQVNYLDIIAQDAKIKVADDSTIKQQGQDITQLRKTQVPPWWWGIGISKQPGAFNQVGSYQVVGAVGRRIVGPVGFAAIAQNRSVGVMLTYNFGGKK